MYTDFVFGTCKYSVLYCKDDDSWPFCRGFGLHKPCAMLLWKQAVFARIAENVWSEARIHLSCWHCVLKPGLVPVIEEDRSRLECFAVLLFQKTGHALRFDLPIIGAMWSWQDIGAVPNARPWYTCFTNGVYQCLAWVLSSHLFRWMGWLDFTGLQDTCCMRPAHFYCHSFGVQRPDIPTPRFSTWNRLGEFQSVVEVQFVLVQVS